MTIGDDRLSEAAGQDDPLTARRKLIMDADGSRRRVYDESLSDAKRERDQLVDTARAAIEEISESLQREAPAFRKDFADDSKDPSAKRLERLRAVAALLVEARSVAGRKI